MVAELQVAESRAQQQSQLSSWGARKVLCFLSQAWGGGSDGTVCLSVGGTRDGENGRATQSHLVVDFAGWFLCFLSSALSTAFLPRALGGSLDSSSVLGHPGLAGVA